MYVAAQCHAPPGEGPEQVFKPYAPELLVDVHRRCAGRRRELLGARRARRVETVVGGQRVLRDAVRRTLAHPSQDGRRYQPRPGVWHLDERHLLIDREPAVGALTDVVLYLANSAAELLAPRSGPYFYPPKIENHPAYAVYAAVGLDGQALAAIGRRTPTP